MVGYQTGLFSKAMLRPQSESIGLFLDVGFVGNSELMSLNVESFSPVLDVYERCD